LPLRINKCSGTEPPESGNWVISDNTVCENVTIIMNGNVTIQSGGNLTLKNVTLKMNSSYNLEFGIEVKDGGKMFIYDNDNNKDTTNDLSNITNGINQSAHFFFQVRSGSQFEMKNSFVSECGANEPSLPSWTDFAGLKIWTSNCIIVNNTFDKNYRAITLRGAINCSLSNNIVKNSEEYGILMVNVAENNTVSDNTMIDNVHNIHLCSGGPRNNTITRNNITGGTYGIYIHLGSAPATSYNNFTYNNITSTSYGIYITEAADHNLFENCSVINSTAYDYYFSNLSSTNTFRNMNWTAARSIRFTDSNSTFNYNNRTDIDLWLKTNVSAAVTLTRKLTSWSQSLMQWNDTSSASITARYNITELEINTDYNVYNNSVLAYELTTDGNGNLPSFTIYLPQDEEHEIKVSKKNIPILKISNGSTSWWDYSWKYRKAHTITGSSAGAQTNYQVKFVVHNTTGTDSGENVYVGSKARSDFGDVRFTNKNGDLIDYWIEEFEATNATFWIEVPSIPASPNNETIYIYYGKSDATNVSNGTATFIFFDDFESQDIGEAPDSNKWDTEGTDVDDLIEIVNDPAGGNNKVLHQHETGDNTYTNAITKQWPDSEEVAIGFKFRKNQNSYSWLNYINGAVFNATSGSIFGDSVSVGTGEPPSKLRYHDGASYVDYSPVATIINNKWYEIEYRFLSTSMKLDLNGTDYTGGYRDTYSTLRSYRLLQYTKLENNGDAYFDNVYVRKLRDPEPLHSSWGSEEAGFVSTSGLVGYWKFDEGLGESVRDNSGYGNDGTLKNDTGSCSGTACPSWTNGRFGQALNFDGVGDYVRFPWDSSLNLTNISFTLESWINPSGLIPDYGAIISSGTIHRTFLSPLTTGSIYFAIGNGSSSNSDSLATTQTINTFEWSHIAATYDRINNTHFSMKIYINGILNASKNTTVLNQYTSSPNHDIGMYYAGGGHFNGTIDEVRIWNRALSEDEIKMLYGSKIIQGTQTNFSLFESNAGDSDVYYDFYRNGTVSGIWHFDEGSGNYTFDETGNNNTGTITSATWNSFGKYGGALNFDNAASGAPTQYVSIPDSSRLDGMSELTITGWIYINSDSNWDMIVSKSTSNSFSGAYNIFLDDSASPRKLTFKLANSTSWTTSIKSDSGIPLQTWVHFATVYNGTNTIVYINGTEQSAKGVLTENVNDTDYDLYIGTSADLDSAVGFNGTIDEVKIYPRALSPEEVLCRYGNNCSEAGFWNDTSTLPPGHYYYTARASGGDNYTSSSLIIPLEITGAQKQFNITITNSSGGISQAVITVLKDGGVINSAVGQLSMNLNVSENYSIKITNNISILNLTATLEDLSITSDVNITSQIIDNYSASKPSKIEELTSLYALNDSDLTYDYVNITIPKDGVNVNRILHCTDWSFSTGECNSWEVDDVSDYEFYDTGNYIMFNVTLFDAYGGGYGKDKLILTLSNGTFSMNTSDLVGYWKFDNGLGNDTYDYSGYGNDGNIIDDEGNQWVTGRFGFALDFDGTNDYVDVGNDSSLDITDAITIEAWVKADTQSGYRRIVSKQYQTDQTTGNSCYQLGIHDDNNWRWSVGGVFDVRNTSSVSQPEPGKWYHVAGTYDGTNVRIYVNGQTIYSGTDSGSIRVNSSEPVSIATSIFNGATNYRHDGVIDEVRIWNRSLSADEIKMLYGSRVTYGTQTTFSLFLYNIFFEDGFETGDFSRWDYVSGEPEINSTYKWSGTYSMKINDTEEHLYKYFEDTRDVYWSWWVRYDNLPASDGEYHRYCGLEGSGGSPTRIVSVEIYNQLGDMKLRLVENYPSSATVYSDPITISTDEWHKITTRFKKDDEGGYQIWFDGNLVLSDMGKNTSDAGDADELRIGYGGDSGGPFVLYMDDIKIYNEIHDDDADVYYDFYRNGTVAAIWHFDENEGNYTFDESGNNNTGILQNSSHGVPTWSSDCKYGKCLEFDNEGDYVNISSNENLLEALEEGSICLWFKWSGGTYKGLVGDRWYASGDVNWTEIWIGNNQVLFAIKNSTAEYTLWGATLTTNTWYHYCGLWNNTGLYLYENGYLSDSNTSYVTGSLINNDFVLIGRYYDDNDFNGTIDEVKIYNRALSEAEILCQYGNNCSEAGFFDDTNTLGAGYYYYTARASQGENYSGSSLILPLQIDKAAPKLILSNNTASVNTTGLVGYWKFDEGLGNDTYDKSGFEKTGTLENSSHGVPQWTTNCKYGSCLEFDGEGDHVNFGDLNELNSVSEFTIVGWFKDNTTSQDNHLFNKAQDENNDIVGETWSGYLYFELGNDANAWGRWSDYSTEISDGEWYHAAFVFNGSGSGDTDRMKIYVNGVERSLTIGGGIAIPSTTADLSSYNFTISRNTASWNGTIDDVQIWNRALTEDEIKELYKSKVTYGTQTNFSLSESNTGDSDAYYDFYRNGTVTAIWHFDEGSENYTFDESGNNNTGTLKNGTTACFNGDCPNWVNGKYGKALEFDGDNDIVEINDDDSLDAKFNQVTVEAWIKPNETDLRIIARKWQSYQLVLGDNVLRTWIFNETNNKVLNGVIPIQKGVWIHTAVVYNGSTITLYVNGSEDQSTSFSGTINNSISNFLIGRDESSTYPFNGTIDEVKVYPRALSSEEILCHYGNNCSEAGFFDDTNTLGAGYYYYTARSSEGENYTSSSLLIPLQIDKAKPTLILNNNTTTVNTSGLVGYWKFDEGVGTTVRDSSGYGNSGTVENGTFGLCYGGDCPNWFTGRFGSALKFDGINDNVDAGNSNSLNISNSFSLLAWIKATEFKNWDTIMRRRSGTASKQTNYVMDLNSDGKVRFFVYDTGGTAQGILGTTNSVNLNDWTFVVGTYNGTTFKVYIDGNQDPTTTDWSGTMRNNETMYLYIAYAGYMGNYFNGTIDEVQIWKRALTEDEIKELYESKVTYGTQTNFSLSESNTGDADVYYDFYRNGTVAAIWHFDEGEGNYSFDETGNNNTGTLENSTHGIPQWTADCKYGSCLEFDGEGDYVLVPHKSSLSLSTMSIEVWFKYNEVDDMRIISKRGGSDFWANYQLSTYGAAGPLTFEFGDGATSEFNLLGPVPTTDIWYHVIVTYEDSTKNATMYVNGDYYNNSTAAFSPNQNTGDLYIAGRDGGTKLFNGTIDEVKIYPRALSPEEVLCHYVNNCSEAGFWNDTTMLGAGYYYYTTRSSGGENYTSSSVLIPLQINKANPGLSLSNDTASINTSGLVGYWRFDEGLGTTVRDVGGNKNSGMLNNSDGDEWIKGRMGYGLDLDGSDDYVIINDSDSLDLDYITLSAWIYPKNYQQDARIISKEWGTSEPFNVYSLLLEGPGDSKLGFRVGLNEQSVRFWTVSDTDIPLNEWTHVAATFNGSVSILYINGKFEKANYTFSGTIRDNDKLLLIGASEFYTPRYFNGTIDEAQVWNWALSEDEIKMLYESKVGIGTQTNFSFNKQKTGDADVYYDFYRNGSVAAIWRFDEGEGNYAFDETGNNNTGDISGASWTSSGKYDNALEFVSSQSDYIDAGDSNTLNFSGGFSLAAWVKGSNFADYRTIIRRTAGSAAATHYAMDVNSSRNVRFFVYDTNGNPYGIFGTTNQLKDNDWSYVVGTYNGSTFKVYIDGIEDPTTASWSGSIRNNDTMNLYIGWHGYGGIYFNGTIDEVKIYPRALSPAEILCQYGNNCSEAGFWNDTNTLGAGYHYYTARHTWCWLSLLHSKIIRR